VLERERESEGSMYFFAVSLKEVTEGKIKGLYV
jgi:hypothetical protein